MTAPALISGRQMLNTIDTAAMRSPNHLGVVGLYVVDGKPSCIGAVVLADLGVPLPTLVQLDDLGLRVDEAYERGLLITLSEPAARILAAAQRANDSGRPWRVAYSAAHVTAKQLGVI